MKVGQEDKREIRERYKTVLQCNILYLQYSSVLTWKTKRYVMKLEKSVFVA